MNFKRLVLLLTLGLLTSMASSSSAQCGFIQDADRRAYCRAADGDGQSQCGFIKNRDMQASCRAKTC